jgi:RimJ/RimL family protein N-acetyltransferase
MSTLQIASTCWDKNLRLEGDRLTLRPISSEEVTPNYLSWFTNPQITQYLEERWIQHSTTSLAQQIHNKNNDAATLLLGITLSESGQHIGNIEINHINSHHLCGTLKYLIGESTHWGQGYMTEAIALIASCAFE